MSDNIPFDIQREIIEKVSDLRSLLRFRSVSKPWKSFIDSPDFYGVRNTQPHRFLLRYQLTGYISRKQLSYDFFIDDVSSPLQEQYFSPNVPQLVYQLDYSKVIGTSCGLWCFHDYITEMIVIWNLSIRKLVRIAVPFERFRKMNRFGFGVCPSTYDPTIVGISQITHTKNWQVHVFTLSSKTWKRIPSSNLPRKSVGLNYSTQVAIDRFIYWGAHYVVVTNDVTRYRLKEDLILSFDLIIHEFKEIKLPKSITNNEFKDISISELNESLVVFAYTNEVNEGRVYGIWKMGEEGGVMPSFTKLFNINTPALKTRILLGFRKSGQPIMETWKKDGESDEESDNESDEESDKESDNESDEEPDNESDEESDNESDEEFDEDFDEGFAAVEVYEPSLKQINDLGIKGEKESLFMCPYKETLLLAGYPKGCIIEGENDGYDEGENDGYDARHGAKNVVELGFMKFDLS